jgi:hypothetical protein
MFFPAADTIAFAEGGVEAMRLDSSGNMGLGVTPSTLDIGRTIQVGFNSNTIWGATANNFQFLAGATYNNAYLYAVTGAAVSNYRQNAGQHQWYNAPSGTAGNAITFTQAMTLDAAGHLLVGATSTILGSSVRKELLLNGTDEVITTFSTGGTVRGFNYAASTLMNVGTRTSIPLTFHTADTERARIDSAGNFSVGTASGAEKITVNGNIRLIGNRAVIFQPESSVAVGTVSYRNGAGVQKCAVATYYNIADEGALEFIGPTGSTNMMLNSSGNLLVGTTSQITSGLICAAANLNTLNPIVLKNLNTQAAGQNFVYFVNSSNNSAGAITHSGTTTVAYVTSSDYRMKENVVPMTGALNKVALLKPCTYTWKEDGKAGQGFIAHELQAVVPDAVTGEKDAVDADGNPKYQGIDTSFLVATLTAAIQEQQALIETLTQRITALEGR